MNIFIIGANGQLGTALRENYPEARFADIDMLDITDKKSVEKFDWSGIDIVINAAAYTNVDGAETIEGRISAWKVNAEAVKSLVHVCGDHNITLVHISTDYVFDGTQSPHNEDEPLSPLNTYGASKAAGDLLVSSLDNYYILRTSWVIGEGKNFVRTMLELGQKGVDSTVVADQIGRLTFTTELVRAIDHLLIKKAPFGTYNMTNDGKPASWADIAREVFSLARLANTVTNTTTAKYYEGKEGIAYRPLQSTLNLDKIKAVGFEPREWKSDLREYIKRELQK